MQLFNISLLLALVMIATTKAPTSAAYVDCDADAENKTPGQLITPSGNSEIVNSNSSQDNNARSPKGVQRTSKLAQKKTKRSKSTGAISRGRRDQRGANCAGAPLQLPTPKQNEQPCTTLTSTEDKKVQEQLQKAATKADTTWNVGAPIIILLLGGALILIFQKPNK